MTKFIPKEKMSKKARKALAAQQRATWAFSPITKKTESKKQYDRNKKSHAGCDDYGMGFCFCEFAPKRQTKEKSVLKINSVRIFVLCVGEKASKRYAASPRY